MRRAAALAFWLAFAGCGGDEAGTPSAPVPTPPPVPAVPPPQTLDTPVALTLVQEGSAGEVRVGDLFRIDESQAGSTTFRVESGNESVATARVQGSGLMAIVIVEPVGLGTTSISVTVSTPTGTATKVVMVAVLTPSSGPIRVVGTPEPVTLVDGGAERHVPLEDLLTTGDRDQDLKLQVEVASEDEAVATAEFISETTFPYVNVVPVSPGEATVTVTASSATGSAMQQIPVTVLEAQPLEVTRDISALTLVAGARGVHWSLSSFFEPGGFRVDVQSLDEEIVTGEGVNGSGGSMRIAPVGPGTTEVVVTAVNAAGEAELTVEVTVLDKLRIGLVSRLASPGGPPVRLVEGARLNVDIRPLDFALEAHALETLTLGIVSDAPGTELGYPQTVTAPRLGDYSERISFPIEARSDDVVGESGATYAVSLSPEVAGLPPWMELTDDVIRVVVVDSPIANCDHFGVDATVQTGADGTHLATFVIQSPHPDTSFSIVEPYVRPEARGSMWPTAATHVFPETLPFRELPDGFEQTVRLRWWEGDLRMTVQAPDCDPIGVHCDEVACEVE